MSDGEGAPVKPRKRRWGERTEEERAAQDRLELERLVAADIVGFFSPDDPRIRGAAERQGVRNRMLNGQVREYRERLERKERRRRFREVVLARREASDEEIASAAGVDLRYVKWKRPGILRFANAWDQLTKAAMTSSRGQP